MKKPKEMTDKELEDAIFKVETELHRGRNFRRAYTKDDKFNLSELKKEIARRLTKNEG